MAGKTLTFLVSGFNISFQINSIGREKDVMNLKLGEYHYITKTVLQTIKTKTKTTNNSLQSRLWSLWQLGAACRRWCQSAGANNASLTLFKRTFFVFVRDNNLFVFVHDSAFMYLFIKISFWQHFLFITTIF